VKLVVDEPESDALEDHIDGEVALATSRIALVEVSRAVALADPSREARKEVDKLLSSCVLVGVTAPVLRLARDLASAALRTLDAIHLASALRIEADELVAYDRRLFGAAAEYDLRAVSPS
jgi:predicted nucleic acid-binding protein